MWYWKANTRTENQHSEISERIKPKGEPYLRRIHDIVGISLIRHLGLRLLLLWHRLNANKTCHCIPQDQCWWQKHIMLTSCCRAQGSGNHCSSFMINNALEDTTATSGVVCSHTNMRHNEKHVTKKNNYYNKIAYSWVDCIFRGQWVNTPGGLGGGPLQSPPLEVVNDYEMPEYTSSVWISSLANASFNILKNLQQVCMDVGHTRHRCPPGDQIAVQMGIRMYEYTHTCMNIPMDILMDAWMLPQINGWMYQ